MRMDKDKAGKTAEKYEAKTERTRSRRDKEKLLLRAEVFRFIEAALGAKPVFMKKPRWRGSRHA